jgi:cation:H+ antiporter
MIPIILALPIFIIGVLLLYKGSDILVEGTSKTAAQLGVSALLISLIIVAFGTSTPELAISLGAAIQSHADISLGNIIGSCVANLLLVLGISAIIRPIKVQRSCIKRELPIVFAATGILLLSSYLGLLDTYHWIGGVIFLILFVAFVVYFIRCAQNERNYKKKYDKGTLRKNVLFIIFGIVGVIAGAWMLIESAIVIADFLGIPAFVIAISMVAVGTSLPELVVSAMAAFKKESDIAIGNVIGSNVFNILLILGASSLLIPLNATASLDHQVILLAVTLLMFPILYTGYVISRREGVFMLILYSIFIWYIFFV